MEPEWKAVGEFAKGTTKGLLEFVLEARLVERGLLPFKRLWRHFRSNLELPGDRPEVLHELFLGKGRFLFSPGTDWRPAVVQDLPPPAGIGYPHEIDALSAFIPLLPEKTRLTEDLFFKEDLTPFDHLVCTGSPKANVLARKYLPSLRLTKGKKGANVVQQYETYIPYRSIPYLFGEDLVGPRVEVISKMFRGEAKQKTRKIIWRNEPGRLSPWQPTGYESGLTLEKDFLLVSRLPRNRVGGDILIFSGAHGAGTEAVRLIFQTLPIAQLRKILDALAGARYYQFVVEVTEVEHRSDGTMPRSIRLSEELPPVKLDFNKLKLRKQLRKDSVRF